MRHIEEICEGLLKIAICLIAIAGMVGLMASFTVIPMMANYRECGTIFLCKNQ